MTELISALRRPARYQRSDAAFWDDEHISKMMLEAHLDEHFEAASRLPATIEKSAAWIVSLLSPGAALLDLGCGPGLYTKRFSEAGLAVTGVDLSRRSIAYAKAHDARTRYIRANYLEDDIPGRYDAVTLIYCDYAALTDIERQALLARVKGLLNPGGFLLFDVFTPTFHRDFKESREWSLHERGGFWSDMPHACLEAHYAYDGDAYVDQTVVLTKDGLREYLIWDTAFTKETLQAELESAGYSADAWYADVCGAPYREDSDTLCVITSAR